MLLSVSDAEGSRGLGVLKVRPDCESHFIRNIAAVVQDNDYFLKAGIFGNYLNDAFCYALYHKELPPFQYNRIFQPDY